MFYPFSAINLAAMVGAHGAGRAGVHPYVGLLAIFAAMLIIFLALIALVFVSLWKIFRKAGAPGWSSIVPVYNTVILLELVNYPLWWIFLGFVPLVNICIAVLILHRLAVSFGRGWWFTVGLLLLPFIFYPILAFGNATYHKSFPPAGPMSEATKFALIAGFGYALFLCVFWFSAPSATPLTMLGNGDQQYATDGTYVYLQDAVIPGADPASFEPLSDSLYAVDWHRVYYDGEALRGVDPSQFNLINPALDDDYAGNDSQVYYDGDLVREADAASFTDLGYGYAKGGAAVYYDGVAVSGADPATFSVISSDSSTKQSQYDAKDARHTYCEGSISALHDDCSE